MKRLLIKIALFTLPFALGFLAITLPLIYSGESMPLRWVAELQMGDAPVLYRTRYGNRDIAYKTLSTNLRRPEIVAVGSSHVLQIRAGFFNRRPSAFYNAGAPAWTLEQVEIYLNGLDPASTPRVLILGLDHPWFNDAYVPELIEQHTTDFQQIFMVNRSYLQDALDGDALSLEQMLARREPTGNGMALGLRAIRDGHGFRNDGSEQYGDFLVAGWLSPEVERQRHLDDLQAGRRMYVRGSVISERALDELRVILELCQQRGITVIAFLPPFMPSLWDQLVAGGQHTYILDLPQRLTPLFDSFGFKLFDFSDGEQLGATDEDFFDGWHASERIYLRMILRMIEALPEQLGVYSDAAYLRDIEARATDTFNVIDTLPASAG